MYGLGTNIPALYVVRMMGGLLSVGGVELEERNDDINGANQCCQGRAVTQPAKIPGPNRRLD
jgi:hypothetical protein